MRVAVNRAADGALCRPTFDTPMPRLIVQRTSPLMVTPASARNHGHRRALEPLRRAPNHDATHAASARAHRAAAQRRHPKTAASFAIARPRSVQPRFVQIHGHSAGPPTLNVVKGASGAL